MNATQHREAVAVKVAPMSHRLPPKTKGWKLEASGDTGIARVTGCRAGPSGKAGDLRAAPLSREGERLSRSMAIWQYHARLKGETDTDHRELAWIGMP